MDEDWEKLPIFMDELPADPENDPRTAALMELINEDTPEERALRCKERGNECLEQHTKGVGALAKRQEEDEQGNKTVVVSKAPLEDAIAYYTQGIEAEPANNELLAVLYSNRGFAQMLKGNNGKAYNDCREAIKLDSSKIKPYYRGAKALLQAGKARDSIQVCDLGLKLEPNNLAIQKIKREAEAQHKTQQARLQERYKKETEQRLMLRAMKKRGIVVVEDEWLFDTMQQYDVKMRYDRQDDRVYLSVLLLYGEFGESDFIQEWGEDITLQAMLSLVLAEPAPWDVHRALTPSTVSVFVDDADSVEREKDGQGLSVRGFVQCDLECTLGQVLAHPKVKVFGMPALHVVVKGGAYERKTFVSDAGAVTARVRPEG